MHARARGVRVRAFMSLCGVSASVCACFRGVSMHYSFRVTASMLHAAYMCACACERKKWKVRGSEAYMVG